LLYVYNYKILLRHIFNVNKKDSLKKCSEK